MGARVSFARIGGLLAALLAFFFLSSVHAQSIDLKTLAGLLKEGGYVVVFRHGATHRDQADTDPLNHDNVARQRLLNDSGRQVARDVGGSFRTLGIPIGAVYSSRFNRAIETAKLISGGEVTTTLDVTEGGLVVTPVENDRRAEALRRLAATLPPPGKNTIIVTHKPNILDAFGRDWFDIREGEASVFKVEAGKAVLVGRVQATEWIKLAQ